MKINLLPIVIRFKNARKAIEQIKNGEWVPRPNSMMRGVVTAYNKEGSLVLWLGNGPFWCDINRAGLSERESNNCFGLFWRHWVWWAAARKLKKDADAEMYSKSMIIL